MRPKSASGAPRPNQAILLSNVLLRRPDFLRISEDPFRNPQNRRPEPPVQPSHQCVCMYVYLCALSIHIPMCTYSLKLLVNHRHRYAYPLRLLTNHQHRYACHLSLLPNDQHRCVYSLRLLANHQHRYAYLLRLVANYQHRYTYPPEVSRTLSRSLCVSPETFANHLHRYAYPLRLLANPKLRYAYLLRPRKPSASLHTSPEVTISLN